MTETVLMAPVLQELQTELKIPYFLRNKSKRVAEAVGKYSGKSMTIADVHRALREKDEIDVSYSVVERVIHSYRDFVYVDGQMRGHLPVVPPEVFMEYDGKGFTRDKITEDLRRRSYGVGQSTVNRNIKSLGIEVVDRSSAKPSAFSLEELLELTKEKDFSVRRATDKLGVGQTVVRNKLHELHEKGLYYYPRQPGGINKEVPNEAILYYHNQGLSPYDIELALNNRISDGGVKYRLESLGLNPNRSHRKITTAGKNKKIGEGLVTTIELTEAIKNGVDRPGMKIEEALTMARHVLSFFGHWDRIIDNVLDVEDRDAFYMLEDAGILTTEREETTLYDGKEWKINYWCFRKERVAELVGNQGTKKEESAYDSVPEEAWTRKNGTQ